MPALLPRLVGVSLFLGISLAQFRNRSSDPATVGKDIPELPSRGLLLLFGQRVFRVWLRNASVPCLSSFSLLFLRLSLILQPCQILLLSRILQLCLILLLSRMGYFPWRGLMVDRTSDVLEDDS